MGKQYRGFKGSGMNPKMTRKERKAYFEELMMEAFASSLSQKFEGKKDIDGYEATAQLDNK